MATKKNVSFAHMDEESGHNSHMDQDTAQRLHEIGATLFLLSVPAGTEIGIDVHSWNTGQKFMGIKMIPPGVHYVFWSSVSSEGQTGPRTGFFHHFKAREVMAKHFNQVNEDLEPVPDVEVQRLQASVKQLDDHLGAYPYPDWKKWISLTNKISEDTLARLVPRSGYINSVTHLIHSENPAAASIAPSTSQPKKTVDDWENCLLPRMEVPEESRIRYTPLSASKHPDGCSPAEVTRHHMDSTYQLDQLLSTFQRLYGDQVSSSMCDKSQMDEVLAELQFSFVCFLVGHHYESFERWKLLLEVICCCDLAILKYSQLYATLINDLYFQIKEVPDDFFVDIVSSSNFLVVVLSRMFGNILGHEEAVDRQLREKALRFKAHLTHKFQWDFDEQDLEDEQPTVVEALDSFA